MTASRKLFLADPAHRLSLRVRLADATDTWDPTVELYEVVTSCQLLVIRGNLSVNTLSEGNRREFVQIM